MDWIRHMLTEKDNSTFDAGRGLAVLSVLVFLGLTIYVVAFKGGEWRMQEFGIGLGAVFVAVGAYIGFKKEEK